MVSRFARSMAGTVATCCFGPQAAIASAEAIITKLFFISYEYIRSSSKAALNTQSDILNLSFAEYYPASDSVKRISDPQIFLSPRIRDNKGNEFILPNAHLIINDSCRLG